MIASRLPGTAARKPSSRQKTSTRSGRPSRSSDPPAMTEIAEARQAAARAGPGRRRGAPGVGAWPRVTTASSSRHQPNEDSTDCPGPPRRPSSSSCSANRHASPTESASTLRGELTGTRSAHRGPYRVMYSIDDSGRVVLCSRSTTVPTSTVVAEPTGHAPLAILIRGRPGLARVSSPAPARAGAQPEHGRATAGV